MTQRIRAIREAQDLTRERLASRANLSVKTVQRAEKTGKGHPDTFAAIAAVLGVPVADLFSTEVAS